MSLGAASEGGGSGRCVGERERLSVTGLAVAYKYTLHCISVALGRWMVASQVALVTRKGFRRV